MKRKAKAAGRETPRRLYILTTSDILGQEQFVHQQRSSEMCNLYITSYNPEEVEIVSVGRRVLSTEGKHEIREKIKSTFKQIAKNEQILLLAWLKGPSVDIVEVFKDIFITPPEIVECRNLCQPYRKSLIILESVTEVIGRNKKIETVVVVTTPDNLEGLRVIFTERFSEWSVDII